MKEKREIRLANKDLNPSVIFCSNFIQGMSMEEGMALYERNIYDYELELITDSKHGSMMRNSKEVKVNKGDLIFRRPGETTQAIMCYSSYLFCFEIKMGSRIADKPYDFLEIKPYQAHYSHSLIDDLPHIYHTAHYDYYSEKFKEILDCFADSKATTENYLSGLILQMLYQFNEEITNVINTDHKKSVEISRVIQYIDNHINESLSLNTLSEIALLSPIYFHQIFSEMVEMTPGQYIIKKRMILAKEKLIYSRLSVKAIGYLVGYNDASYFCLAFKKETGMTPLTFRSRYQYSIGK